MSKVVPFLITLFSLKGGQPGHWKTIINEINSKAEEAKYFANFVKTKIKDLNQETQLLALDLIDFVVAEGKMPVWTQIASKDFLTSLIGILKTRDNPEVQLKILYLIKKWGTRFESYKELLPNFSEFYKSLKSTGAIIFPDDYQPEYIKYIGDYNAVKSEEENINKSPIVQNKSRESKESPMNNYKDDFLGGNELGKEKKDLRRNIPDDINNGKKSSEKNSSKSYKIDLNPDNYDKKYSKLINKLSVWFENIILANDMIDNTKVGTPVDDGLRYVIENLREAEKELVIYIQEKVKNEKILELCLGVNDDLNKTIARYDVIRSKSNPEPFTSNFEYRGGKNSGTEHKKSSRNKSKNADRGRNSSKSPIRESKKSSKPSNDLFDVFDLKNEVNNISIGDSKKQEGQTSNNVKSVDDIFEIFGGNMNVNSNFNANANMNPNNTSSLNSDVNIGNKVNNQFVIDFNSPSTNQRNNQNNNNPYEPVFNLVGNSIPTGSENNQSNIVNNNGNIQPNNSRPGIFSLEEKLKNIYNAKDDENNNQNMNNKRTLSPNMSVGINSLFNFPGQPQQQFANFNNMMPGYNMMYPGMINLNMQPSQMNLMNMGLNPTNPANTSNPINNINQVNQMNPQVNRFNPGFDSNFQMPNNTNNLNNNNIQNDPFNF